MLINYCAREESTNKTIKNMTIQPASQSAGQPASRRASQLKNTTRGRNKHMTINNRSEHFMCIFDLVTPVHLNTEILWARQVEVFMHQQRLAFSSLRPKSYHFSKVPTLNVPSHAHVWECKVRHFPTNLHGLAELTDLCEWESLVS